MGEISFKSQPNKGISEAQADGKLLWAFAVDATKPVEVRKSRTKRATKPKYKLHRYLVTSCSPRLREYGVRSGMTYGQAKRLAPNMQIFVYNR